MSKYAAELKSESFYENIIKRWHSNSISFDVYEDHLLSLQKTYKRLKPNVYFLNKIALKIQHFYFNWKLKQWRKPIIENKPNLINSSQIYFKQKYGLNSSKLVLSNQKQVHRPPKVIKK